MRFRIESEVFQRFPAYCVGLLLVEELDNSIMPDRAVEVLRDQEKAFRHAYSDAVLVDIPALAVWHQAFTSLGFNAAKFPPSVQALAARVLKGIDLPSVTPVVDLVNALSLRYLVPVGAHDLARLVGDLVVGPIRQSMPFTPLGSSVSEVVDQGEFAYADSAAVRTRRWVWRQNEQSKVTAASTRIVFPIDGWRGDTLDAVKEAVADLREQLSVLFGVAAHIHLLDAEHPEVDLSPHAPQADTALSHGAGFRMSGKGYLEQPQKLALRTADLNSAVPQVQDLSHPVQQLLKRRTVEVIVREDLERRLQSGDRLRVKLGVDPTGPHLTLGHAVQFRKLREFQQQGHTICLVVGDFTAQIGDASDKTAQRQILPEEVIYENLKSYRKQIAKVLDADKVEWSYNSDWLGPLRFKDVIGLAMNFTVAQILERENFALRYAASRPIGLHEFFYPLMQGYDSVALKSDVEIGGTEQLFNLMAGRTLQQAFGQSPQAVITIPLLLGPDGKKMSKTAGNCIYIDDHARDMYGKVMSIPDQQIIPYFELCTDVPVQEIEEVQDALSAGENPMRFKKRLALEITALYHGPGQAEKAQTIFKQEVQRKELPDTIEERHLSSDAPQALPDLLLALGLVSSKSEARRLTLQNGVRIDGAVLGDPAALLAVKDGMLVQVGKRKFARVRLQI